MKKIDSILFRMNDCLNSEQLQFLKVVLTSELVYEDESITDVSVELDDTNEILTRYMFELKVNQKSDATLRQYKYNLSKFFSCISKGFRDITADDLNYYIAKRMLESNVSINTINNERKSVHAFYKWATENGYIAKADVLKVKNLKSASKMKIILTEQEIEIIRDSCKTVRELALIDFLLSTGVRVGELVNIRVEDIDFVKSEVHIFAHKTQTFRTVFLDAKASKHISEYVKDKEYQSQYLFSHIYSDEKLDESVINKIIHKICERTKITKQVTVHTFRKTLASRLHSKGMSAENIAKILGHASMNTTINYYVLIDNSNLQHEFNKAIG